MSTISTSFRKGIFRCEEVLHELSPEHISDADITYILGTTAALGPYSYVQPTIICDLTAGSEEILMRISPNNRNKIYQAIKHELCTHSVVTDVPMQELIKAKKQFDIFAAAKGIAPADLTYLKQLNEQKALALSYARDKDGHILSGHVYRVSALRPELHLSYRDTAEGGDTQRTQLISKAHRYSHYMDMLHFKEQGFAQYGLGGVSDESLVGGKGVNDFKLSLGGRVEKKYNSIIYRSLMARAYIRIRGNYIARPSE